MYTVDRGPKIDNDGMIFFKRSADEQLDLRLFAIESEQYFARFVIQCALFLLGTSRKF